MGNEKSLESSIQHSSSKDGRKLTSNLYAAEGFGKESCSFATTTSISRSATGAAPKSAELILRQQSVTLRSLTSTTGGVGEKEHLGRLCLARENRTVSPNEL